MATITVRNLDEKLKAKLRVRAAQNNRSMEEEVRIILAETIGKKDTGDGLAKRIHRRFADIGGIDLPEFQRDELPRPLDFEE